ncbi:hypothetical protein OJF2_28240 [Aquisphaera giovannonii]|uniref:Uncharacterized protein n=1 Tax=Aquisphaera giovannonii TaxID=406548 RepID=A0A5B9W204_9BACT|nr:hypothetical protein OJF2_28240 [Aquisphaera giovannonii]
MTPKLRRIIGLGLQIAEDIAAGLPADGPTSNWPGFGEGDWIRLSLAGVERGSADAIFVEALAGHAYEVLVSRGRAGEGKPSGTRPGNGPSESTGIVGPMPPDGQPSPSRSCD